MANDQLKEKIYQVLTKGYFNSSRDLVDVSDGSGDLIHLVVVSRKFDGNCMMERHNLIWSELTQKLAPEEWSQISLSVGMSPEEIKAM